MAEMKYFRTNIAGLNVIVGDPEDGEVAPQSVRFEAYEERYQGEKVKVGYLATDNEVAVEKLSDDANVEEIKKSEFEQATDEKKGAKRASI